MRRSCSFCKIATAHPPVPPSSFVPSTADQTTTATKESQSTTPGSANANATADPDPNSHAFLILSTKHVLAFLDIMPLTRGHVLVVPRNHYEKLGEVGVGVGRELGQWLPILSRVVMRTIFGSENTDGDEDVSRLISDPSWHWNVVQNNGVGAAQVVPHVHFHIVPRPPLGAASTAAKMSFIMFGKGSREDLDDEDAEKLVAEMRGVLAREVLRVREVEGVDLESEFGDIVARGNGTGVVGKGML